MIAICSCGFPIVYFKIFGESSSSLLNNIGALKGTFWASKEFMQLVCGVVCFFFIIKKELNELKSAGFILLAGVCLFVLFLFIRLCQGKGEDISDYNMSEINFDIKLLANIPTLMLSYGFQSAFFPAYNSLKVKNDRNAMKAVLGSFTICFTIYMSIILVSLFTYGNTIDENILTNVGKSSDTFSIILQIIFLVIATMHIPIVYFVGKENVLIIVDELVRRTYSGGNGLRESMAHGDETPQVSYNEDDHNAYITMNPILYYSITIGIYLLIILLSIVVKSLVLLLGVIGSTGSMYIIYIGPASFFLK